MIVHDEKKLEELRGLVTNLQNDISGMTKSVESTKTFVNTFMDPKQKEIYDNFIKEGAGKNKEGLEKLREKYEKIVKDGI